MSIEPEAEEDLEEIPPHEPKLQQQQLEAPDMLKQELKEIQQADPHSKEHQVAGAEAELEQQVEWIPQKPELEQQLDVQMQQRQKLK